MTETRLQPMSARLVARKDSDMKMSLKPAALMAASAAAALLAVAAIPQAALADPADGCAQQRHGNEVAGAIVGGIAGAAIGNGASHDRGAGTALGALAGGALGAGIGGAATNCEDGGPPPPPPPPSYGPPPREAPAYYEGGPPDDGDGWRGGFHGYPQFRDEEAHIRAEIEDGRHEGWLGDDQARYFHHQLEWIDSREMREFNEHGWDLPPWDQQQIRASLDRIDRSVDQARDYGD
jgi:hypothetical protein